MKPLALIILDGWGVRKETHSNGLAMAKLPHYQSFLEHYPSCTLQCSGKAVGLPDGVMGNSEVGHMTIGAGRIVYQGLSRIYASIEDKSFFENPALLQAMLSAKKNGKALHLMGLLSDGSVHSHRDHLTALLDLAKTHQLKKVFVHCFMDGRDTSPTSGVGFVQDLVTQMKDKKVGQIATLMGRFWAMDRDKRWDRIEKAYDALVSGKGQKEFFPVGAVKAAYDREETDEFIKPIVLCDAQSQAVGLIQDGDAVIFYNFRADRAREITRALTQNSFTEFERKVFPKIDTFTCFSNYGDNFKLPVAFEKTVPENVLGAIVARAGMKQLRIAETEKYAHVTYFFNGGEEKAFEGEDRVLIPSPRELPTYDQIPEMSALQVTDEVLKRIASDHYKLIVLNFANADMVGHTAIGAAIIKAAETVDTCLGKIVSALLAKEGTILITADHGNAEQMTDADGNPHTQHTTNPVPFVLINKAFQGKKGVDCLQTTGGLEDIAPTILDLMELKKPDLMTGQSLMK